MIFNMISGGGSNVCCEQYAKLIDETITAADIPDDITTIGQYTFYDRLYLQSVNIPDGIININAYAFAFSGLKSVDIPSSVVLINGEAFMGCSGLTRVVAHGNIGVSAFKNCTHLTDLDLNGVNTIGKEAFMGCTSLASVDIPSSVSSIGDQAFQDCSSLTDLNLSNGLTSIGGYAFMGCANLPSVDIPSSVSSIGDQAFRGCTSLTNIIVRNTTPPTITQFTFYQVPANANIYVPAESVSAYQSAQYWSDRASYIQAIQ